MPGFVPCFVPERAGRANSSVESDRPGAPAEPAAPAEPIGPLAPGIVGELGDARDHRPDARDRCPRRGGELARALVALVGVLGHRDRDDLVERLRQAGPQAAGPGRRLVDVGVHQLVDAPGREGLLAHQRLVQHAAQGVDVDAVVAARPGHEPFGRHVGGRADQRALLGEAGVAQARRDPEVDEVGELGPRPLRLRQQDVRGLDVAVDQRGAVGGVERRRDLLDDRDRPLRVERPGGGDRAAEVDALDEAHVQVELPVDLAVVVDRDDVGLVQPGGHLGLAPEARGEPLVAAVGDGEALERDRALLAQVGGPVHLAHGPAPDHPLDPVRAEAFARHTGDRSQKRMPFQGTPGAANSRARRPAAPGLCSESRPARARTRGSTPPR